MQQVRCPGVPQRVDPEVELRLPDVGAVHEVAGHRHALLHVLNLGQELCGKFSLANVYVMPGAENQRAHTAVVPASESRSSKGSRRSWVEER